MQTHPFHPAVWRWFEGTFDSPTEPQLLGWPAIHSGDHALICAPTGSGKTLAAFLASLDILFREGLTTPLPDETRVLYVSPLKALGNDIRKNLQEPLRGISAGLLDSEARAVDVRAEVRTGDTPAAQRQALAKRPPHILVTTPESLYLLLTSDSGRRMLATVRTLIIDEIHAVVNSRRGSHLALSIERLAALTRQPLQRIGLSATQRPIEEVARFLVGTREVDARGTPRCRIINAGHARKLDLAVELPESPLQAVMSAEVWEEVHHRLAELIREHRTTLVFVNTRRLAERVTRHLGELLGKDQVTSHHGSLSKELRLDAEDRLKRGELKALVATASLELGIDIGSVDLVCQIGSTRSISTLLQRVGRAGHRRGGLPKGRIFPLSRDELVECAAALRCIRHGELDRLILPEKPMDVLAQQIVASTACEDCGVEELFERLRRAWPYRELTRDEFDRVVKMLAEGFSTKRGRRAALIHHDAVNGRLRARRGVRLLALTSGGAIPDNADYRVVLEPAETFIGTVNEDFAIESMAGDIFQLGNASWRILRVTGGMVRVADAQGQPPTIPFWLGEAPSRTHELSHAVSSLRAALDERLDPLDAALDWLIEETGLARRAALQIVEYYAAGRKVLGGLPTQQRLVIERFFDESGGMQLVIHSPFGSRLNRAWGLALRKRFCRKFNFELQAAAGDDAIVISLGTQHSFPLDEVFRYLNAASVRNVLEQALLDAPMFTIRWRWNAACALAVPRQRGGTRVPAPLQRFEAEHLLAAVFPDQLACLEHIVGDREIPDHPLVQQAITDCLNEVMDIEGLTALLADIENGRIECVARDLPEPSPLAHEIINARPYTFLDNAPLEERRTQAVYTRRALEAAPDNELGMLDSAAIAQVQADAWPAATNADELHDALLQLGLMSAGETTRTVIRTPPAAIPGVDARGLLDTLSASGRAAEWPGRNAWLAVERIPLLRAIYTDLTIHPALTPPPGMERDWDRADAIRELIRGRLEVSGPITVSTLANLLGLAPGDIDVAMIGLETEGFAMRGRFHPGASETEWCDRRLLARIHRLTLNRLRAEIQPVSVSDFHRFLFAWQRVDPSHRASGPEGLESVLEQLDGFELPLAGWEPGVLASRMTDYDPQWLDRGCLSGRVGWGRLTPPQYRNGRPFAPLRSSPIALYQREHIADWLELARSNGLPELSPDTQCVWETLRQGGALFFTELVRRTALLPSHVEQALSELAALGCVTSDSFDGVRALLLPSDQRPTLGRLEGKRRHNRHLASVEFAGRWSMLRMVDPSKNPENGTHQVAEVHEDKEPAIEICARVLLRRYGVLFRRLLERESLRASWFELGRVLRRWEARGEIRGGHFVSGVSGEQFALPEAIALMRSIRKQPPAGELITLSGADPLNLIGILTPGGRLPALAANRILFRDGNPVAVLESGQVRNLDAPGQPLPPDLERALTIGTLPAALRPYYG